MTSSSPLPARRDNPSARPSRVKNRALLMESSWWIRDLAGRRRDPHLNVNQWLCCGRGGWAGAGQDPAHEVSPKIKPLGDCSSSSVRGWAAAGHGSQAPAGTGQQRWTRLLEQCPRSLGARVGCGDTLLRLLGSVGTVRTARPLPVPWHC